MKQAVPILAALAVVGAFSTAVYAQSADRAIKYRQGILQGMGWHMGVLGGMAKGERPYDKEAATRSASYVHDLAAMAWEGFTPGSESGAPTRAKPEIWKEKAKFDKHANDLKLETAKLVSAAGTDLAALRTAMGSTGRACSNCHDGFRSK